MHVRVANESDIPDLVNIGYSFMQESPNFKNRGYVPEQAENHFKHLINGGGVIFVVEIENVIIGGFAGGIAKDWQSNFKIAFDYVLFVEKDCRKTGAAKLLIDTFIEWAKSMGADRIHCGTTTEVETEGCVRLYQHMGFKTIGHLLEMEL